MRGPSLKGLELELGVVRSGEVLGQYKNPGPGTAGAAKPQLDLNNHAINKNRLLCASKIGPLEAKSGQRC